MSTMSTWTISDEGTDTTVDGTYEDAIDACVDRADCYDASDRTQWITFTISDEDGMRTRHTVTLDPVVPDCFDEDASSHQWTEGQACGSGGGVRGRDTCRRCGMIREWDTWATNPADGSQGHSETLYREGDDD